MRFVEPLGWALVHFLWQGALIAALYWIVSAALRRAGAEARYLAGCVALLAMTAAPLVTLASRQHRTAPQRAAVAFTHTAAASYVKPVSAIPAPRLDHRLPDYFPALVALWLAGVTALSSWSAAAWAAARRLPRVGAKPAPEEWRRKMQSLALRIGVSRPVRLVESTLVRVPSVVGALRPVILLPASALLSLSPQQLEALIAHELAHIRRHDYLVNLFQTVIETLLFYHPAVWWVSASVRREREHCCDDIAVAACGDLLTYARALTGLEEIRAGYALAAGGGSLASRIRRLLGGRERAGRGRATWLLMAVPVLLGLTLWAKPQDNREPAPPQARKNPAAPASAAPAKSKRPPAPQAVPAIALAGKTPAAQQPAIAPIRPSGFLAALSAAGYRDLSVDEIIDLKNHGVTGDFILDMKDSGWGRLSAKELIELRQQGVSPDYARAMRAAGLRDISVRDLPQLRQHQVDPDQMLAIHTLGFGPYSARDAVDLFDNGVRLPIFRSLKEAGYKEISPREAIDLQRHGLSANDLREARKFNDRLSLPQIVKLKRAGVI